MRRALRLVSVTLGVLLGGATFGLIALLAWSVATPSGARSLVEMAPRSGVLELQVRELEGRLLGPLELRGFLLKLPGVEVEAELLRLEWRPWTLLDNRLNVDRIEGRKIHVRLLDTPPSPEPASAPRIPQLPLAIRVAELRVDRVELWVPGAAKPQVIEEIALDRFAWEGEVFGIERFAATHALSGPLTLVLDARLRDTLVDELDLQLGLAATEPAGSLRARGSLRLDAQPSTLDLDWTDLRWPLGGEPVVSSREGQVQLSGTPQALKALGAFALGDTARVRADAQWSQDRIAAELSWTGLGWPLIGKSRIQSAEGAATVSGTPRAYRYTLDAALAAEGRQGRANASGSGGLEHVNLDALNLAVARSRVAGNAQVRWSPALDVTADLSLKNVDPGLVVAAWPGRLNGALRARTQMVATEPQVSFDLALDRSELRGYPFVLQTRGISAGTVVDLAALKLRSGATQLEGSGRVTPPFDLRARLDSSDLASLWPGLGGALALDADLRGPLQTPHLVARGSAHALRFNQLALEDFDFDADVDVPGAWSLRAEARGLSAGTEVRRGLLQVSGHAQEHRVTLDAETAAASATIEARGAFDREPLRWTGALTQGRLTPKDLPEWTLEEAAALRLDAQQMALEAACWAAGPSRLCAQGLREPDRIRTAFRLEQLDFAYFASFLPLGWTLSGGIDGTGRVEVRDGAVSEIHAELDTQPVTIVRDGQVLLEALPGTVKIDETAGVAVANLHLPLKAGALTFHGELDPAPQTQDRVLRAQLDVGLDDLGFVRLASQEIERVRGRLEGRMNWTGTAGAPLASGEIRLLDGALRLLTPGIDIQDLAARVGADADGALQISASARSGGGEIEVSGDAHLAGEAPRADLRIRGKDFQAANMTEARAWISPDLRLRLDEGRLALTGDLLVPRAEITPVSFDSGVAPSSDQVIVTGEDTPGTARGLQFGADVRLVLGDAVSVDGFGLKTRLAGSVRAIEEPGRPSSGRGEVRLEGGRYKAYGQDLEIEYGRLLFNGGPLTEPAIEIRALRKPREDIEVGVFVRGTLDRPEFQLYSTPTMPRERQLSWLVLGRSLEESGSGDEKAMLANAALSLGLAGTNRLAQNVRGGLRVDEVSIGAQPGEDAQQARFTVGKYLSPKLYVSYGVGLFQPGHIFKLLYELGHGFKLSTESGVHTGGDLLYTVERP